MEISDLVESVDIVEYIGQYCDLEQKGREFWACSPLKEERTPSFSVDQEKQRFFDFSSGCGGDVLTFIQEHDGCGFSQALTTLKNYAGVKEPFQHDNLLCTQIAKRYKKKQRDKDAVVHKILPKDYMDRFIFDDDKLCIWENEGISKNSLKKFDVRYDKLSNRLMYPVCDTEGNIVNICGRTLDQDYKEKGLRKYTYTGSWGGGIDLIYGLDKTIHSVKKKGEIILFEGAKSVMKADTWGIYNTGAILTSHLNPHQMFILIKLGVEVVFALDEDVDISKDKNIQKLMHYVRVYVVKNKDGRLKEKDSPVDGGLDTWNYLYERRESIN